MSKYNENRPQGAQLTVTGGGHTYELDLTALQYFLDNVHKRCNIEDDEELRSNLNGIANTVVDGTADDCDAGELKQPLKLLQELTYLFNGLLHKQPCRAS